MKRLAIIGIHTGIGKTIASAVICEALQADYWKPVQAGNINESDSIVVKSLVCNKTTNVHTEAYLLSEPLSPHIAASIDETEILIEAMRFPETNNLLIVETAGGLMSPLNETQTNLDFILHFNLPVILISQHYLGSINHTLLTCEALKKHRINVKGILFNGIETPSSQQYISKYTGYRDLGCIPLMEINKSSIEKEAKFLINNLEKNIW